MMDFFSGKKKQDSSDLLTRYAFAMLEAIPQRVMFCDADLVLRYVNPAARQAFQRFSRLMPVSVDQMIGVSIDRFHKNPERVRRILLGNGSFPHMARIHFGPETLGFQVDQIRDSKGATVGYVVNWDVVTDRVVAAEQMRKLKEDFAEGHLNSRTRPDQVEGEMREVLQNINSIVDVVIRPLQVSAEIVRRISEGDIPEPIQEDYRGDFGVIKGNLNTCIGAIKTLLNDIGLLADAAVNGRLSERGDVSRHRGDYARIVEGINATLSAVMSPINEATQVLHKLAERDLSVRVEGNYKGDHAVIKKALNQTAGALEEAISQVREATKQVSEAANQIAGSGQDLARMSVEQSAALQRASENLKQITEQTRHNTENAVRARKMAENANNAANFGAEGMQDLNRTIQEIREATTRTGEIIRDINEIAFQTNMLALNAAVEAARAGQAGAGFAVVAEEVRALAQRAKEASQRTEALIRQSVERADRGEALSQEVSRRLEGIVADITTVTEGIKSIAGATEAQTRDIGRTNDEVQQIERAVQRNAATAEEASSVSEELAGQAEEMASMAGAFRIDEKRRYRSFGERRDDEDFDTTMRRIENSR